MRATAPVPADAKLVNVVLERRAPSLHLLQVGAAVAVERGAQRRHRGTHLLVADAVDVARGVVIVHGPAHPRGQEGNERDGVTSEATTRGDR